MAILHPMKKAENVRADLIRSPKRYQNMQKYKEQSEIVKFSRLGSSILRQSFGNLD